MKNIQYITFYLFCIAHYGCMHLIIDTKKPRIEYTEEQRTLIDNSIEAEKTLKLICVSQYYFKKNAILDKNSNGIGEYGLLEDIVSESSRENNRLYYCLPEVLCDSLNDGIIVYKGYCFVLYLLTEDFRAFYKRSSDVCPEYEENIFIIYAWPASKCKYGNIFYIATQNKLHYWSCDEENWGIDNIPAWNYGVGYRNDVPEVDQKDLMPTISMRFQRECPDSNYSSHTHKYSHGNLTFEYRVETTQGNSYRITSNYIVDEKDHLEIDYDLEFSADALYASTYLEFFNGIEYGRKSIVLSRKASLILQNKASNALRNITVLNKINISRR